MSSKQREVQRKSVGRGNRKVKKKKGLRNTSGEGVNIERIIQGPLIASR